MYMEDLQFGEVSGSLHLCNQPSQVCKTDFLFNFHTHGESVTVSFSYKVSRRSGFI